MSIARKLLMGAAGAGSKSTYVDDVFSTYVYTGNDTSRSINNGIDLAGEGGMTWVKARNVTDNNWLADTERGVNKLLKSNNGNAEVTLANSVTAFNNNGFSLGSAADVNWNTKTYASWSFRKQKGFFDIVTWTGDGSDPRNISHSLGSNPGCIFYKRTDASADWIVYNRHLTNPATYLLQLDGTNAEYGTHGDFGSTLPTASVFTVASNLNTSGATYVAYLFAGGESTADTARSVDFDGSGDRLTIPSSTDWDFGSGDFTIECWVKGTMTTDSGIINRSNGGATDGNSAWILYWYNSSSKARLWFGLTENTGWDASVEGTTQINDGHWHHIAVTREGNNLKAWTDGILEGTTAFSGTIPTSTRVLEIASHDTGSYLDAEISNVRVVKGTAVYTSSFRPPTEPLTNITNTKLLCCNNSSTTGATVSPGTITSHGDPTASTDSPFDDPEGFVFGENGDQSIIKCGVSRAGSGGTVTAEDIGWEPQWLMQKQINDTGSWFINDSMRGWDHSGFNYLRAESTDAEATQSGDKGYPTSQGFKFPGSWWSDTNVFIWVAIRRPDGLVGKPGKAGTESFAMDTGDGSGSTPTFDSGFPVDFALKRSPASAQSWAASSRLTGTKFVQTNNTDAQSNSSDFTFDSNVGYNMGGTSSNQSWMWNRGQGMDVVCYKGTGVAGNQIKHSLGQIPEMIWLKSRSSGEPWPVYHKGLNGGTNPQNYYLQLNSNQAESEFIGTFNNYAPTALTFEVGYHGWVNTSGNEYLALLFASVAGISKVGSYTGANPTVTVTTGFQPRFVIIKIANEAESWVVLDTTRGWGAGNDEKLVLNTTTAQVSLDISAPTSTGFTVSNADSAVNISGYRFIYYAHA